MKEFQITLDQTEISFLKISLEVILNRQLNSIAEKNLYLIKNQKKLKKRNKTHYLVMWSVMP